MMKIMYNFFKVSPIVVLAFCSQQSVIAATKPDDAQQALQQLRMLQQRLSQNGNEPGAPTTANGPGANTGDVANLASGITPAGANNKNNQSAQTTPTNTKSVAATSNEQTNANEAVQVPTISESETEIVDKKAFQSIKRSLYPLSPGQVAELKQDYQTNEYAQASTAGTPPKPTATSQFVNLSPGSTPPVIRLSQGFVSSLVFLDSTGAPWPISAYDLGDPSAFNIQWDKTSNTLMIQAMKLYNYGNLAVRLKGLNTPVMLTLIPGQKAVDYRVDLRVQGYGPNAKGLPLEAGVPPAASDLLLHVLEGVPPPASQRLVVNGGDARAWLSSEKMYVRTNLTILSPGWLASMTSADGMHAYEMQKSPVLLVSWHGKVMQLKIEGL